MALKEKIDHNTFVLITWLVLGIFWVVSFIFTTIAFTSLGEGWTKLAWFAAAVAWEGGTLVVVSMLKTAIVNKGHWFRIFLLALAYVVMASVPFIGSLGFNLANEHKVSTITKAAVVDVAGNEFAIEEAKKETKRLGEEVDRLTGERNAIDKVVYPTKWRLANKDLEKAIADKSAQIKTVTTKSGANVTATTVTAVSADDLFREVGTITAADNWKANDGSLFKNFIFVIFGLVVILMVALAAPTIEEALAAVNIERVVDIRRLEKYLDAMFDVTGRRMAKDDTIAEQTGFDIEECKEFRDYVMGLSYNDTPLFVRDNGGTKSNFSKEHAVKIALFCVKVGKTEIKKAA
jgi:hypothetical protein